MVKSQKEILVQIHYFQSSKSMQYQTGNASSGPISQFVLHYYQFPSWSIFYFLFLFFCGYLLGIESQTLSNQTNSDSAYPIQDIGD